VIDPVAGIDLPGDATFFTAWLLGASMGLTSCTVTCLPFIGTWVLGRPGNNKQAVIDTGIFLFGRLISYAFLGAIAGGFGVLLIQYLKGGISYFILGAASILSGCWLLYGHLHKGCLARSRSMPPLILGIALTLTPCAPLASLLTVCAATGSIVRGFQNGVAFGLGATLTPLLILVPLVNTFGMQLRSQQKNLNIWIRSGSAAVLIAVGTRIILSG
jgi:cytochrome c-type biogenesis protein